MRDAVHLTAIGSLRSLVREASYAGDGSPSFRIVPATFSMRNKLFVGSRRLLVKRTKCQGET